MESATKQSKQEEFELHSYNKRLALACQAGKIYRGLGSGNGTAELPWKKTARSSMQITHSFTERIHPDYRKVYENITRHAQGRSIPPRINSLIYFSDDMAKAEDW